MTVSEHIFATLNIHTASNVPNNVQVQSPRVFRFRSPHNNAMSSSYASILRSNVRMPQSKVGDFFANQTVTAHTARLCS